MKDDLLSLCRDALHAHPTPTLVVAADGGLALANAAALERLGCDATGPLADLPWAGPGLQALFEAALREEAEAKGEVELGPHGGSALATAAPILGEEAAVGAVIRLEPREEGVDLEALAAGLAHEIKNPLAGLKGAAELMEGELAPGSPLRDYTRMIVREAIRVNGLIQSLLDLSRPPGLELERTNLHEVCEAAIEVVAPTLPPALRIERRYDPSLPEVCLDPEALQQLLLNLLQNAVQAMEGREGAIEVETGIAPGRWVRLGKGRLPLLRLAILDRGPGLPPALELFTPFATTRQGGTGLGLVVARRIAEAHEGRLSVEDRPGGGVRAELLLPLRREG